MQTIKRVGTKCFVPYLLAGKRDRYHLIKKGQNIVLQALGCVEKTDVRVLFRCKIHPCYNEIGASILRIYSDMLFMLVLYVVSMIQPQGLLQIIVRFKERDVRIDFCTSSMPIEGCSASLKNRVINRTLKVMRDWLKLYQGEVQYRFYRKSTYQFMAVIPYINSRGPGG